MNLNIAYVLSTLKRVGPTNQTLNIIKNSKFKNQSIVITLFDEDNNDTMINEYKKNDIEVICLHLNEFSLFRISTKKKLLKIFKEKKINIVHSTGIIPDVFIQKYIKNTNIKHIITLRNYPKEDIPTRMNYIKGKLALYMHLSALKKCKHLICCSKTIYNKIKKDYPKLNCTYIQNGVDINIYSPCEVEEKNHLRKIYKINLNKKVFISTGSFIPRKRIDESIEGFIKANINDSIFLLLGEGPLFKCIREKYKNFSNIIFIGKTNKVVDYLRLSDYFISSSESEGLPNSVIEAISCGLPVILSNIPQHIEILEELPNAGITYDIGNLESEKVAIASINKLNIKSNINESPFSMVNMSLKYCDYYIKTINGDLNE